mgnify:CR=1 FL=1
MIIDKISKDVEDYFRKLVTDEFQGHQGLALKYLCDLHKGICPNGHEELEFKLDTVAMKLAEIEERLNQTTESRKEHIKTLGGVVIG